MADTSNGSKSSDRTLQKIILVAVLFVGAILGAGGWALITARHGAPEVVLPLLAIGGLLSLLIVLALVSVFFETLGLANKDQALALPEGSVRAVIALSLIVLFAILSVYLYASLAAGGQVQSLTNLSDVQKNDAVAYLTKDGAQVISAQPTQCPPASPQPGAATPAACTSAAPSYTVYYRARNAVSEDFAKQLLVLLGTLVTAVASFYFGANTVASAQKAAKEGPGGPEPTIQGVIPDTLAPGGSSESFTVTGDNLNSITHVRLERSGVPSINVDAVQSNGHKVTGKLTIAQDASVGKWNVVVSDDSGKIRAELKNGFEVKTP
jgi:hypothetical protein